MKILLTGATGFIGSHLAERLVSENHEVHAIIRPTSNVSELPKILCDNVNFHIYNHSNTIKNIVNRISGGGR